MATTYEWDIETWYLNEDREIEIHDHDHRDQLSEFPMEKLILAIAQDRTEDNERLKDGTILHLRLVLVRDSDRDGRAWAYVTDEGEMPEQFLDAYEKPVCKVPKKYIEEFNL